MTSATLSFVDERYFLTVIQSVPAPTESVAAESPIADPALPESPPADPAPAESSTEPLHSSTSATLAETS
jgi:hypothetical protein